MSTKSFVGIHHLAVKNGAPRFRRDVELLDNARIVAVGIRNVAGDEDDLFVVRIVEPDYRPPYCASGFDPKHRYGAVRNAAQIAVLTSNRFRAVVGVDADRNTCDDTST